VPERRAPADRRCWALRGLCVAVRPFGSRTCAYRCCAGVLTGGEELTSLLPSRFAWAVINAAPSPADPNCVHPRSAFTHLVLDAMTSLPTGTARPPPKSNSALSRAQFVPNRSRKCGHSRLFVVSFFLRE
jgi:hypothetical protein